MLRVKFKPHFKDVQVPRKAHAGDAAYDIFVHSVEKKEDDFYIVHTGFSTEIPLGWYGQVVPRSSFTKCRWILNNSPATIDSIYTGEWQLRFRGIPKQIDDFGTFIYDPFPYDPGDRCAQVMFKPSIDIAFESVAELSDTDRGDGGFGSSGE